MYGYKAADVLGQNLADVIIPPHLREAHWRGLKRYLDSGEATLLNQRIETVSIRADGSEFPVELTIVPMNQNSQPMFIGFLRDITERKRMEEELLVSETRYRAMIEELPLAVQVHSPDGFCLQANRAWEKLWGVPREELQGYNILQDEQLKAQGLESYVQRGFAGEITVFPPTRYDPADIGKPGRPRWVEAILYPVRDAHNEVREVVLLLEDVSTSKITESELRRTTFQLEVLYGLTSAIGRSNTIEQIYDAALDSLMKALEVERAGVLLTANDGTSRFKAWRGVSSTYRTRVEAHPAWPPDETFTQPLLVPDVTKEPGWEAYQQQFQEENIGALALFPLISHGQAIGRLGAYSSNPHEFEAESVHLAQAIAQHVAVALQRRIAERELQESRDQLSVILQGVAEGITVQSPDGQFIYANEVAVKVLSFDSAEQLLATPVAQVTERFSLCDENGNALAQEQLPGYQALHGETAPEIIVGFDDLVTGELRWSALQATPVFDSTGAVLFAINIFRDITERKRAEDTQRFLAEASRVLGSSLDYQTTLKNVSRMAVPFFADWCVVDVIEGETLNRLSITHVDPEKERIGWESQKRFPPDPNAPTGPYNVCRTGEPEMTDITDEMLNASIENLEQREFTRELGLTSYICVPMQARGQTLGAITFISARASRLYREADLQTATDLASRAGHAVDNARLYKEAQQAREEAIAANRAKDEFLAIVSHELRTPLTSILGWAALLRMGGIDEEQRTEALETIERNARAQAQLVGDILDVSRIVTGKMQLDLQPLLLSNVVMSALDSLRPAIEEKALRLTTVLDGHLPRIEGDATRLQQVISNLVGNAIKFTERGGQIEVALQQSSSGEVELAVCDTGRGIDPDFLPLVFERFRQSDSTSTRRHGGLGLGLSIVRHLVELHGGTIEAYSAGEGQGATFTMRFPAYTPDVSTHIVEQSAAEGTNQKPDAQGPLTGLQILVVEDDADTRLVVQTILKQSGAEVLTAESAQSALEILNHSHPQLLLCDIAMPDEDGYSLLRKIRALPGEKVSQIPAIAMTAFAGQANREEALSAGFLHHLSKPVDPPELIGIIAAYV
jgi:PAS domain S-box-containing protein